MKTLVPVTPVAVVLSGMLLLACTKHRLNEAVRSAPSSTASANAPTGPAAAQPFTSDSVAGTLGEQSIELKLRPVRSACEAGEVSACRALAYRLSSLTNTMELNAIATSLRKGCERAVPVACGAAAQAGLMKGELDLESVIPRLREACDKKDSRSCGFLAELMIKEIGPFQGKSQEGQTWVRRLCQEMGGYPCYTVATLPAVRKDPAVFLKLMRVACQDGDGQACYQAGIALAEPLDGVDANPVEATRLYKLGCDRYLGQACFNLAWQYLRGTGAPTDEPRGIEYLKESCILGDPSGCDELSRRDGDSRTQCKMWGAQSCYDVASKLGQDRGEVAEVAEDLLWAAKAACRRGHKAACRITRHLARDMHARCESGQDARDTCMYSGLLHLSRYPVKARVALGKACRDGAEVACTALAGVEFR